MINSLNKTNDFIEMIDSLDKTNDFIKKYILLVKPMILEKC